MGQCPELHIPEINQKGTVSTTLGSEVVLFCVAICLHSALI
jgi:hypothetical protein